MGACPCECVTCVWVPKNVRRGSQSSGVVSCPVWVVGTKLESSWPLGHGPSPLCSLEMDSSGDFMTPQPGLLGFVLIGLCDGLVRASWPMEAEDTSGLGTQSYPQFH